MWALENRTPFSAERGLLRDLNGAERWIVAVKGTFVVEDDGTTSLAGEQLPVLLAPEYVGEPGQSDLRYDTDMVLSKPSTDIVLHGQAHIPDGHETVELVMEVGLVSKRLEVSCHGPREAAGFGPVPAERPPRASLAGTYDTSWRKERLPLLPLDFDERFHQCAPEDQQASPHLRGGERVRLTNLTPGGLLEFSLPEVSLTFCTEMGGEVVEHPSLLHTVILEPDLFRVQLVWHTSLACHGRSHGIRQTTIGQQGTAGEPR